MALLINIGKENINKICRICLLECDVTPLRNDKHYDTYLTLLLCCQMQEDTSYPLNICQDCSNELKLINLFIKKLKRSITIQLFQQDHNQAVQQEIDNLGYKNACSTKNNQEYKIALELYKNPIEVIVERNSNSQTCESDMGQVRLQDKNDSKELAKVRKHPKASDDQQTSTELSSKKLKSYYELSGKECINDRDDKEIFNSSSTDNETITNNSTKSNKNSSTKDKQYFCKFCEKFFTVLSNFKRHMSVVHEKAKPFMCGTCGERFTVKDSLKYHLYIHTDTKPFECDICHHSFRQPNALLRHKRTKHVKEKNFECEICGKKLKYEATLQKHLLLHLEKKS